MSDLVVTDEVFLACAIADRARAEWLRVRWGYGGRISYLELIEAVGFPTSPHQRLTRIDRKKKWIAENLKWESKF